MIKVSINQTIYNRISSKLAMTVFVIMLTSPCNVDPLTSNLYIVKLLFLCILPFIILVISRFGFEGWIWVLIASVPDLCILFTFKGYSFFLIYALL